MAFPYNNKKLDPSNSKKKSPSNNKKLELDENPSESLLSTKGVIINGFSFIPNPFVLGNDILHLLYETE
jgi:hypothetical protein